MAINRANVNVAVPENLLSLSWHDSQWIPLLNTSNVMDYFSERSNPFFDRTCNNEIIKMQRLNQEHLQNMTGLEYALLHVQEPILYVIRKQHRHSPTQVTPITDYYMIAGIVYQAPDLFSIFNSRLLSTIHHLQSAFDEVTTFVRYHPNKGYSWNFKNQTTTNDKSIKSRESENSKKDELTSTLFQRQRVDMLLGELTKKFPIPQIPIAAPTAVATSANNSTTAIAMTTTAKATVTKLEPEPEKVENKSEMNSKMSPPEKKVKLTL